VATVIRRLPSPFLQSNELVAKVDERHGVTFATEFEPKKATVKRQCLLYIANLQGYVVQSNGTRSC